MAGAGGDAAGAGGARGGCAAGSAFRRGESLMRSGDLDMAVASFRKAVQGDPDNAHYKIALQRAMLAASRLHIERARQYEQMDQLEAALGEYKLASEYDPTNRMVTAKVADLDRTIRERVEASRPKPAIQIARERARAATTPAPLLNLNTPLRLIRYNNASLRDILGAIAASTGINVTYDRQYQDRQYTVQLDGETLEQALNQILSVNQLSYKVLSERSILVFDDNAQKHGQYDDQVIQTFYLSNADATELAQLLSQAFRPPGIAVQPAIAPNKTANSITIRATAPVVAIFEKIIQQNDKPRAEIVVDIEIMEVNRARVKSYGLNLSEYALGGIFSPEVSPSSVTTPSTSTTTTDGVTNPITNQPTTTTTTTAGKSTPPEPGAVAAAVQPEHDHARDHDGRLLHGRSDRHRQVPRVRYQHQARGQTAAPRRGRHEADVQSRRPDSRHLDELPADRRRWSRHESAELVQLQGRRSHGGNHAARDARRGDPARRQHHQQLARQRRQHRRRQHPVLREPRSQHAPAPARRRVEPAGRPAARRRTQVAHGLSRRHSRAGAAAALLGERRGDHPDRRHHAADAARRTRTGHHRSGSAPDLHRVAAEPRRSADFRRCWRRRLPLPSPRRRQRPPARYPRIGETTPGGTISVPPGASPIPGTVVVPNPPPAAPRARAVRSAATGRDARASGVTRHPAAAQAAPPAAAPDRMPMHRRRRRRALASRRSSSRRRPAYFASGRGRTTFRSPSPVRSGCRP